ncbi:histidine kinase [Massilia sp. Se16.2.3]|nr:histidine kinase [Massilia sp. Se16.2.3]
MRVAIASALACAVSLALVLLAGLLRLALFEPAWWRANALPFVCIGVVTGNTLLALFRLLELGSSEARLARLRVDTGWRTGLLFIALALLGIVLGCALGLGLVHVFHDPAAWGRLAQPGQRIRFALFMLVLAGAGAVAWLLRARRLARRRSTLEAQLQLLQAQIEPQFLFNTLADVQILLELDPDGARQMLEEFTDYLRASLGQLRRADSTVAAELDMAQCYLQLLRLRMGERLRFSIQASTGARAATMAPLLLQPLVENAVKHGLEPKPEGGCVQIHADVRDGRLEIAVIDDGAGLPATPDRAGLALENIRARLAARHGPDAALTLAPHGAGTRAMIVLPLIGAAVDSSQAM